MCAVDPQHPASVHELVSAAESTTCYTEVAPGQEAGFTVLMRTPNRTGNFISYWRLTGPDGNKFGHRLWCDVNVQEPAPIVKEEPEEAKFEAESSQMIFPKLEKESPSTSIHEEVPAAPAPVEDNAEEFEDFVDEPLEDDETEDGFMTDEEYDILDASDEEYLAEQEKAAKK
jgi:next-to-BRCA1 protein 1